jgi:endonuclease/exonuclease/phosphatase family metal-dependent hydrolase
MSFNLRMENPEDGANYFFNRTDKILNVIASESPDVIGFQEVTDAIRAWLYDNLAGYTLQGCGRKKDCSGEAMMIAYRKNVFSLLSLDNVWLSDTPRVPGSRYGGDQSGCPRMATIALLKHTSSPEPFRFINTHLDHEGKNARLKAANQLIGMIRDWQESFVMTGDFNAKPDTEEIHLITDALSDRGVVDCTRNLGDTYHGFGLPDKSKWMKIDYIFTDGECVESYAVTDAHADGVYYSDHNAVCAKIILK